MPVASANNYNTQSYPDLQSFFDDLEKIYDLGWTLVSFAFQGTMVIAVYMRQQVVTL